MSKELEGAALFDAAARAIRHPQQQPSGWELVPAMLKWLWALGMFVDLAHCSTDGQWRAIAESRADQDIGAQEIANDLPTALARLVLRVAELDGTNGR